MYSMYVCVCVYEKEGKKINKKYLIYTVYSVIACAWLRAGGSETIQ